MYDLIGVKLKENKELMYFNANKYKVRPGQYVIVDTPFGIEIGIVIVANKLFEKDAVKIPFDKNHFFNMVRFATKDDLDQNMANREYEAEVFKVCFKKIKEHKLKMNLQRVETSFMRNKILVVYTAEQRVDFRQLVKDLAGVLHCRVEMWQTGIRDNAKTLGGLGPCGREFCCKTFQNEFSSVSVKLAKEQGLSLNPVKISGTCGRLMCCLTHEYPIYHELYVTAPKVGAIVSFEGKQGTVIDINLLAGTLRLVLTNDKAAAITAEISKVTLIKDADESASRNDIAFDNKFA